MIFHLLTKISYYYDFLIYSYYSHIYSLNQFLLWSPNHSILPPINSLLSFSPSPVPIPIILQQSFRFLILVHHPSSPVKLQPWTDQTPESFDSTPGLWSTTRTICLVIQTFTDSWFPASPESSVPHWFQMLLLLILSEKKKSSYIIGALFFSSFADFIGSRVLPLSQAHPSLSQAISLYSLGCFSINYYPSLEL